MLVVIKFAYKLLHTALCTLANSGVIVIINIICAIVFAAQVERNGQWILILCSAHLSHMLLQVINSWNLTKVNSLPNHRMQFINLVSISQTVHRTALSHHNYICDSNCIHDSYPTHSLMSIQSQLFFPHWFSFGRSIFACNQGWRTGYLIPFHWKWVWRQEWICTALTLTVSSTAQTYNCHD